MFTQENLWLCDNGDSYDFEMSFDNVWQGSVKTFSNIKKGKMNVWGQILKDVSFSSYLPVFWVSK